jgi:hypothetical protein
MTATAMTVMTVFPPASGSTSREARVLARLQKLAKFMDTALRIPFTRIRFGADSILGLVPGAGDVIGMGVSAYALLEAYRLGAPRSLLLRMLGNATVDAGLGAVPLVGDVFDLFFKSNTRNLKLVAEFIEKTHKPNA